MHLRGPIVAACFALAFAACSKQASVGEREPASEAKPPPVREPEIEIAGADAGTDADALVEPQSPFADVDLRAAPGDVLAALSRRWCEVGGDNFRPPGPPDEAFPPRLERCEDVGIERHSELAKDGIEALHFTIDAPLEAREFVLLRSPTHAALLELAHEVEDTSGEGGVLRREHLTVELRDLTGTSEPEWVARFGTKGGDSYEADRCYAHDEDTRALVVCSESAEGFACGSLVYHATSTTKPRPAKQRDECDVPTKALEPSFVDGFAFEVALRRETLVLEPSKTKIHEPEDPVYTGEVAIATLLEEPLELAARSTTTP